MILTQSKIINTNKLNAYKGKKIRVTVEVRDDNIELIKKAGFKNLATGERILPAKLGNYSMMNADDECRRFYYCS